MPNYPSRWLCYLSVVIFLLILCLVIWFFFVPINPDLYYNIFSEILGMIGTVILLMFVVEVTEYVEWKNVEKWVKGRIGKWLYHLFNILSRFIYAKQFRLAPSKEEILKILKALSEMKEAKLNEYARYYYFPKPRDDLSVYQLDVLFRFKRYLSDLETKYFRFFKPEIRLSLMEIQDRLDSIEADFNLVKRFEETQEIAEKSMSESILGIMKEIYKLHKLGIEIYPEVT